VDGCGSPLSGTSLARRPHTSGSDIGDPPQPCARLSGGFWLVWTRPQPRPSTRWLATIHTIHRHAHDWTPGGYGGGWSGAPSIKTLTHAVHLRVTLHFFQFAVVVYQVTRPARPRTGSSRRGPPQRHSGSPRDTSGERVSPREGHVQDHDSQWRPLSSTAAPEAPAGGVCGPAGARLR
jgi:hypothetical protein